MTTPRTTRAILAAGLIGALLTGCSSQAVQDRSGGAGGNPDGFEDAWNVKVFLNADHVPNTVLFCINRQDPLAILSTLSGSDAQIVRMPEFDASYCGGRKK